MSHCGLWFSVAPPPPASPHPYSHRTQPIPLLLHRRLSTRAQRCPLTSPQTPLRLEDVPGRKLDCEFILQNAAQRSHQLFQESSIGSTQISTTETFSSMTKRQQERTSSSSEYICIHIQVSPPLECILHWHFDIQKSFRILKNTRFRWLLLLPVCDRFKTPRRFPLTSNHSVGQFALQRRLQSPQLIVLTAFQTTRFLVLVFIHSVEMQTYQNSLIGDSQDSLISGSLGRKRGIEETKCNGASYDEFSLSQSLSQSCSYSQATSGSLHFSV